MPLLQQIFGISTAPVSSFSPASYYPNPGFWWDPSDLSTVYTDLAKTTNATIGDNVKVIADKSGNGHDLIASSTGPQILNDGTNNYLNFTAVAASTMSATITSMSVPFYWCMGIQINLISALRSLTGGTGGGPRLEQWSLNNRFRISNGATLSVDNGLVDAAKSVYTLTWNGASSEIRRNGTSLITGNAGSNAMTTLSFNSAASGTYAAWRFYGIVCIGSDWPDETEIEDWMAGKSGAVF